MNDKGEMTCPICTEEMDLTDQQLKPCKCGYQICVWCWHQIMEMAEKDKSEGRCPACRTPYDKEKIAQMTVSCERLVAEINNDRKKSQKVKPKPSEGRKELTGVRVIQRNLVYVMSLPLELADENLFQRREYFGQYGKVIKVAMSRTASGAVQQFPNNTCSVYITYSKEEEAIRCIQSVHGFILDGRSLKACFGTMKYCHAWLRNTPCTNAECLYLHEFGSQEDSFTKDETISLHMRKLVQQITGAVGNFPRRSGSMLPPPVDDYVDNNESSTRKVPKSVLNNANSVVKSSPLNGSNGRSVTLPAGALWGMHSSRQSSVASTVTTNSAQVSTPQTVIKKPALEDDHAANENELRPQEQLDDQTDFPELSLYNRTSISNSRALVSASVDNSRAVAVPSDCTDVPEHTSQSCERTLPNGSKKNNGRLQSVCSNTVSVGTDGVVARSESSQFDYASIKPSQTEVSQDSPENRENEAREVQTLQKCSRTNANEDVVSREVNIGTSLMPSLVTDRYIVADDDISLFNRQRLRDPEVLTSHPNVANGFLHTSNCMQPCISQYEEPRTVFGSSTSDGRGSNLAPISHGYIEMPFSEPSLLNNSHNHSMVFPDKARDVPPVGKCSENSISEMDDRILANILSLDLDEYLTSPHNFSKPLGADEIEARSQKLASASEVRNNQSRFSFARQEESNGHVSESCNAFNSVLPGGKLYQNSSQRQSPNMDILGMYNNGYSSSYLKGTDYVTESSTLPSSYNLPSVPRCPVSAPPGFSVASRPPPPGFASNGREQQTFNGFSGNHRFSDSTMFSNPYQSLPIENTGGVRSLQFTDPAILCVGQRFENASLDFRSNFQGNPNFFGNEATLQQQQLMMQNPLSLYQNCRSNDSLGMAASRLVDQSQGSSNIHLRNQAVPNGQWDGLSSEIQRQNRLQNERIVASANQMNGYNGTFRI